MPAARLALLLVLLAGCAGTPFRWQDADRVRDGMTEREVVAILGPPASRSQQGAATGLVWVYVPAFGGIRSVSFTLLDGRVVGAQKSGRGAIDPAARDAAAPIERGR